MWVHFINSEITLPTNQFFNGAKDFWALVLFAYIAIGLV